MGVLPRSEPFARKAWARLQDGLFYGLTVLLWLAGCTLAALGAVTAAFFLLSGARLHPFLFQLHNMAARYVAADAVRQAAFADLAATAVGGVLAGVCLLRLPVLCRRLAGGGRGAKGRGA